MLWERKTKLKNKLILQDNNILNTNKVKILVVLKLYMATPLLYTYKFGPIDRVVAERGSAISAISSIDVLAAIFKKRTVPPMTLGIFQGTHYREEIEKASQQMVKELTNYEETIPANLICLLYDHGDFDGIEFKKNILNDHLHRIIVAPFYAPPNFQQKTLSLIDIHFVCEIINEASPVIHKTRMQKESKKISDIERTYGLTRAEALYRCALADAVKRAERDYKGVPEYAKSFNLFFAQFLGILT